MLKIRRGIAARSYENSFFREFGQNLSTMFDKYQWDGLLIGNSECTVEDRLQIDALLITKKVVLIIDFKNFGGDILLPHTNDFDLGRWTNSDGEMVKGGSSINPYCQLKTQRKRFYDVYKSSIEKALSYGDSFNPGHTVRIVCFQKEINLKGSIPSKDEINFRIIHKGNYLEKLKDVIEVDDREVNISPSSYDAFTEVFEAAPFDVKEEYNQAFDYKPSETNLDIESLRKDQRAALGEIDSFISSEKENAFILQGTSNSGKTHLIPFIKDRALELGIAQVEVLAPSSRIANNLVGNLKDIGSLYSYIYGGNRVIDEESESADEDTKEKESKTRLEIVPLKQSDDEENTLYIIDESQLISDSYHQSIDLRFGSGFLLKDFIKFLKLDESKRKVVFIGDCYQISLGKHNENPLSSSYLSDAYELKVCAFQLDDHIEGSVILANAIQCVSGIRKNLFNSLSFDFQDKFASLPREGVKSVLSEYLQKSGSFKFLTYTNEEAGKINLWIKKSILNNGEDLSSRDLLLLNNNIKVEIADDPLSRPQKLYNGQSLELESASDSYAEEVQLKEGKSIKLLFRELKVKVLGKDASVRLLSLENFRTSVKGELSDDEVVAIKILLNRELTTALQSNPFESSQQYQSLVNATSYLELKQEAKELKRKFELGEKVKTKLEEAERKLRVVLQRGKAKFRSEAERNLLSNPDSKYYKLKYVAYVRFGWALNVHKAMSYKWDNVIFNVDWNGGTANTAYFKWLYTGLTRATNKIKLVNYQPIHPLLNTDYKDSAEIGATKKDFYLVTDKDYQLTSSDEGILNQFRLSESVNKELVIQLYQIVLLKFHSTKLKISSIEHPNYQQVYTIQEGEEVVKIRFDYNGKLKVKQPTIQSGSNEEFKERVLGLLLSNRAIDEFSFVKEHWRSTFYKKLNESISQNGFSIPSLTQRPYKDFLVLSKGTDTLEVELNYNGDGFFSSIISKNSSSDELWSEFLVSTKSLNYGK